MISFCEQCGEQLEDGDDIVITDNHVIHEWCEDEYIDDMKSSWTYKQFNKEDLE